MLRIIKSLINAQTITTPYPSARLIFSVRISVDKRLTCLKLCAFSTDKSILQSYGYRKCLPKLYRVGILEGVDDDHYFLPDTNIKRSEIAVVAARMMNPEARVEFSI